MSPISPRMHSPVRSGAILLCKCSYTLDTPPATCFGAGPAPHHPLPRFPLCRFIRFTQRLFLRFFWHSPIIVYASLCSPPRCSIQLSSVFVVECDLLIPPAMSPLFTFRLCHAHDLRALRPVFIICLSCAYLCICLHLSLRSSAVPSHLTCALLELAHPTQHPSTRRPAQLSITPMPSPSFFSDHSSL